MSAQELAKVLRGTTEEKLILFQALFAKATESELEDWEVPIFETLKRELIKPQENVVSLTATVSGSGSLF